MVQTHRTVGNVAAREVCQVVVAHGDRDGKEPFVGVCDQGGVAGRVLRRDRWELMKRRRHGCGCVTYRPKRALNNLGARHWGWTTCSRQRRCLRLTALLDRSAEANFNALIRQKATVQVTSAGPNRSAAKRVPRLTVFYAETEKITFRWHFGIPAEIWRSKTVLASWLRHRRFCFLEMSKSRQPSLVL